MFQDEQELLEISDQDRQKTLLVGDMRQKVAEAKSSLSSNRSRNKVLDALMQQKRSGKIPGILGRLVRPHERAVTSHSHTHTNRALMSRLLVFLIRVILVL